MARAAGTYRRIYGVVRRIPRGCVATYGQVAHLAGLGEQARQVGYALHALDDDSDVPWHRVVNARGAVSLRAESGFDQIQRLLLEGEGVLFDGRGRVCLETYRWEPGSRRRKGTPRGGVAKPRTSRTAGKSWTSRTAGKSWTNRPGAVQRRTRTKPAKNRTRTKRRRSG
jgi:methylated-DNA-protein-cysteine methyltransferase-like protein